jgi:hypothetical protein
MAVEAAGDTQLVLQLDQEAQANEIPRLFISSHQSSP